MVEVARTTYGSDVSASADQAKKRHIGGDWKMACSQSTVSATLEHFLEVTNLLLEQVQLNSSHLFRADILHDSSGTLRTLVEKEARCQTDATAQKDVDLSSDRQPFSEYLAPGFAGFELQRTVIRRLIPRKPQLDKPLEQSCFIYKNAGRDTDISQVLVVYLPHCSSADDMPWYHPKVKALAYLYSQPAFPDTPSSNLSIYYLLFSSTATPLPDRLSRTFVSLLNTMIRLLKLPPKSSNSTLVDKPIEHDILTMSLTASALKDTIIPQHIVQNTYTRLKETYAKDLIARWVETTEPSKHVFEDLSIAAFLIQLWDSMYDLSSTNKSNFSGFMDIACGNGVLVYILTKEGFRGCGFDARRRKTWEVLGIDEFLEEKICVPKPFMDVIDSEVLGSMNVHDGLFPAGTFIISNHADELTCWTPLLAALSSPSSPLPFLAIPCCSHALDGSKHRYTLKEVAASAPSATVSKIGNSIEETKEDEQPAIGDLKAMRAAKQKGNAAGGIDESMYACLTRKTAALARELGMDVELTLMRIPSTRNIGIVGNRRSIVQAMKQVSVDRRPELEDMSAKVVAMLERECGTIGGVKASAKTWVEKARKLNGGQGRGKVNWNGPLNESG